MNEPSPEDFGVLRNEGDFDADRMTQSNTPSALPAPRMSLSDTKRADLKKTYSPDPHRLLPQSPDAEKGVLSSMLIQPREVIGLCAEKGITAEHFAIPAHGSIFNEMVAMDAANEVIDFITLTQWLHDKGKLDQCGGAAFITQLFTFLPTAANASYYVEILTDKFALRQTIKVATEYAGRAYDEQDDAHGLTERFEQAVFGIANKRIARSMESARQLVVAAIGIIEDAYSRKGSITGISTGFPDLDKLIDGMHDSEMIVIAARPSMGKTALAMNIAEHVAVTLQRPVGIFSLEMTARQLMTRMLCARARVDLARVRDGFLSERDFPALQAASNSLSAAGLFIDDSSDLTIQELRGRARRMKQQNGIAAVFIDYLQLVKSISKRALENRQQEVAEVSAGVKAMAKELGVPVIVLAQLSREFDKRATGGVAPRPRMSDLRESGSIEQDADVIGFLTRDEFYAESAEDREHCAGKATLTIAKQRNGPLGEVALTFLKEFTRFEQRAREHYDEEEEQRNVQPPQREFFPDPRTPD